MGANPSVRTFFFTIVNFNFLTLWFLCYVMEKKYVKRERKKEGGRKEIKKGERKAAPVIITQPITRVMGLYRAHDIGIMYAIKTLGRFM